MHPARLLPALPILFFSLAHRVDAKIKAHSWHYRISPLRQRRCTFSWTEVRWSCRRENEDRSRSTKIRFRSPRLAHGCSVTTPQVPVITGFSVITSQKTWMKSPCKLPCHPGTETLFLNRQKQTPKGERTRSAEREKMSGLQGRKGNIEDTGVERMRKNILQNNITDGTINGNI